VTDSFSLPDASQGVRRQSPRLPSGVTRPPHAAWYQQDILPPARGSAQVFDNQSHADRPVLSPNRTGLCAGSVLRTWRATLAALDLFRYCDRQPLNGLPGRFGLFFRSPRPTCGPARPGHRLALAIACSEMHEAT